jgi:hypothetical protein
MKDYSIMIPARDYKLIEKAITKNRYPVEDPEVIERTYSTSHGDNELLVRLMNNGKKFYLKWTFISNHGLNMKEITRYDMNYVTFDKALGHLDVDPTYE